MPSQNSTFQLFVLGDLSSDEKPQALTILAEFKNGRAIERVPLNQLNITELTEKIATLRGFIEAGFPTFDELALEQLGGKLFDTIIQNNVRTLFDRATGSGAEILPLEIFVEDYTIASWPWEYLYDSNSSSFLCQEFHPISRGLFTLFPEGFRNTQSDKIRILLVVGVLADDPNTTPQEEIKWIQEVFRSHIETGKVELTIKQDIEAIELELELQRNQYDILHFFGHAGLDAKQKEGYLRLDNSQGKSFKLRANTFGRLLAKQGIRLVFLNACETAKAAKNENPARSSVAAALLGRGIPAVISTQFSMPDTTSHYLSSVIYGALANGKTLGDALRDGRRAMSYDTNFQIFDWGIPVLYCSNPNIVIFSYTQAESETDEVAVLKAFNQPYLIYSNPQIQNLNLIYPGQQINIPDFRSYILEPGDNIAEIAADYQINFEQFDAANSQIQNPDLIDPNPQINISNFGDYTVQPRDNIAEITANYQINFEQLYADIPQIQNSDIIYSDPQINISESEDNKIDSIVENSNSSNTKVKVAIVDIDSKAGYLPELIRLANQVQKYYSFKVAYLPIPSNAVRTNIGDSETLPQLYLPLMEQSLSNATQSLNVDLVCCLTRHLIAFERSGKDYYNYFSASLSSNKKVSFVSTYDVREYAAQANLEFAQVTFIRCLPILIVKEGRWKLKFHHQTCGCLFDFCANRDDIVEKMKHRKFDHQACRSKIKDPKQLKAIDALIELEMSEELE